MVVMSNSYHRCILGLTKCLLKANRSNYVPQFCNFGQQCILIYSRLILKKGEIDLFYKVNRISHL